MCSRMTILDSHWVQISTSRMPGAANAHLGRKFDHASDDTATFDTNVTCSITAHDQMTIRSDGMVLARWMRVK